MDTFDLLIAAVLAIPVLAVISLIVAMGARKRLKQLELRIAGLEWKLAALGRPGASGRACHCNHSRAGERGEDVRDRGRAAASGRARGGRSAPRPRPGQRRERIGLEERFGTQWVVWAGGIALALGGFFLVRYSIEQGWFGPGARVVLAGIVALALIAAGEWARRREISTGAMGLSKADIPSVLTAAGTAIAYADAYAAYALYGFIGPAAAFVLLGIVALGTLAASLVHGPALAGLGLVGAFLTPLIVSTEQPNYWALYLYLAVVTAAAFAPRPGAALALARRHRGRGKRALGAARHRRSSGAWPARLPHRRRLHARGPADRLGPLVRAGCRAGRDRPGLVRRARRLSVRRDAARARDRP